VQSLSVSFNLLLLSLKEVFGETLLLHHVLVDFILTALLFFLFVLFLLFALFNLFDFFSDAGVVSGLLL
jgi:hypothetical protein